MWRKPKERIVGLQKDHLKAFELVRLKELMRMLQRKGAVEELEYKALPQSNVEIPFYYADLHGHKVKYQRPSEVETPETIEVRDYDADIFGKDLPDRSKVTLFFDTCVINELLRAKRLNSNIWLDLVLYTAKLPTVKMIIIPSIIADWELRGGITVTDEDSRQKFIVVDEHQNQMASRSVSKSRKLNDLLESAGQYRADERGCFGFVRGDNPKIMIVETETQRSLAQQILGLNSIVDPEEKRRRIADFRKKDYGELAIEEIATNAPINTPVFIISNDIKHFTSRDASKCTANGDPIGTAKSTDYLKAELSARGDDLKKLLGIISIAQFCEAVIAQGLTKDKNRYPMDYKDTGPGEYIRGGARTKGAPLHEFFVNGVQMIEKHPRKVIRLRVADAKVSVLQNPEKPIESDSPPRTQDIQTPQEQQSLTKTEAITIPDIKSPVIDNKSPAQKTRKAKPVPAKEGNDMTESTLAPTDVNQIEYTDTLGYKIGDLRISRDMSHSDLVTAILLIADKPQHEIDAKKIHQWESNRVLIPEDLLGVLEDVLINANPNILDKEQARSELRIAYDKTREAILEGKLITSGDLGEKIFHLRQSFGDGVMTEKRLAELVQDASRLPIEEKTGEINERLMLKIEAGAHLPSKGMFLAILKVLNQKHEIEDSQRLDILESFAAYQKPSYSRVLSERRKVVAEVAPANEKDDTVIKPDAPAIQNLTAETPQKEVSILSLKQKINDLLSINGRRVNFSELARATSIAQTELSNVLGIKNNTIPSMSQKKLEGIKERISKALQEKGLEPAKLAEFNESFSQLMQLYINIKANKKPSPETSFASNVSVMPQVESDAVQTIKTALISSLVIGGKAISIEELGKNVPIRMEILEMIFSPNKILGNFTDRNIAGWNKTIVTFLESRGQSTSAIQQFSDNLMTFAAKSKEMQLASPANSKVG